MHASERTPLKPPQSRVAGESCKLASPNLDRWLAAGHPRVTQPGRATRTPTGQLAFNLKPSSETACHPEHPQLGEHKAPGPHISGPLARQGLPGPLPWFELGVNRPGSYLVRVSQAFSGHRRRSAQSAVPAAASRAWPAELANSSSTGQRAATRLEPHFGQRLQCEATAPSARPWPCSEKLRETSMTRPLLPRKHTGSRCGVEDPTAVPFRRSDSDRFSNDSRRGRGDDIDTTLPAS